MNRLRFPILLWVIAPILIALLMRTGLADAAAASSSAAWKIVPSPNGTDLNTNTLNGVAAVSVNDVWAVGSYFNNRTDVNELALTEHWNGSAWKIVFPPPAPNSSDNFLEGVKVISRLHTLCCSLFYHTNLTSSPLLV